MTASASETSPPVAPPPPQHPPFGRRIIKFLSVVLAAYTASHVMIKLSGTALWLPREWRIGVDIFATLIGTLAFRLGSEREKREPPLAPGVAKDSPEAQAQGAQFREHEKRRAMWRSMTWAAAGLVFLFVYMTLRGACVYTFDARDWHNNDLAVSAARQGPATAPADDIPDYVDITRNEIYLPLWLPNTPERDYFKSLGDGDANRGIRASLKDEPDRVIDAIGQAWHLALNVTSVLFAIIHIATVFCFAFASGWAYAPIESLIEILIPAAVARREQGGRG